MVYDLINIEVDDNKKTLTLQFEELGVNKKYEKVLNSVDVYGNINEDAFKVDLTIINKIIQESKITPNQFFLEDYIMNNCRETKKDFVVKNPTEIVEGISEFMEKHTNLKQEYILLGYVFMRVDNIIDALNKYYDDFGLLDINRAKTLFLNMKLPLISDDSIKRVSLIIDRIKKAKA